MMKELHKKNELMQEVDTIFMSEENLDYEERVIMRAITCLGLECSSDLAEILNMENVIVDLHIDKLLKNQYLEIMDR